MAKFSGQHVTARFDEFSDERMNKHTSHRPNVGRFVKGSM